MEDKSFAFHALFFSLAAFGCHVGILAFDYLVPLILFYPVALNGREKQLQTKEHRR
jgi:hypothetical protein